jgi:DNA polymerase III delta prime subunit
MDFDLILSSSHHAILFDTTNRETFLETLRDYFDSKKIFHEIIDSNVIDIETSRDLKTWNVKSYGKPKVMIVSFHTITIPAQNALLKVLEEPYPDTRFILITSYIDALLPTVRSRLQVHSSSQEKKENTLVAQFLKASSKERMELEGVQELLAAKDTEDRKDREGIQQFLGDMLIFLTKKGVDPKLLQETADCVLYASDPSSSSKMLLEYVALRLPRVV